MRSIRVALVAVLALSIAGACARGTPQVAPTSSRGTPGVTAPATQEPTSSAPTRTRAVPSPTPTPADVTRTITRTSTGSPSTSTTTTAPAPFPGSLLGKDIERIPTSAKVIALTFDAGANADAVAPILDTLAQSKVTATFFLTGDFVVDFPGAARQIADAGHRLGNHSVNHPHFTELPDSQIRAQLRDAESAIRAATGSDPAPLFRFPYGDRNARTIAVVNQSGYLPVRWTVDSLGWQGTMDGTRGSSFVRDRVLGAATPGGIVLMHVGSHPTDHSTLDSAALPGVIDGLRALGYTFVTLDALLA